MTRQLAGCVDGIHLGRYQPGFVYLVGTLLAAYFFAEGAAEPAEGNERAFVLPPAQQLFGPLPES